MSWNSNDLLRFRFLLWKSLVPAPVSVPATVPVPDPDLLSTVFLTTKFIQNLAFSMIEVALFPRKLALIFDFVTFVFYCMLDPGPNPVPEPLCITVQVPIPLRKYVAVPVVAGPVPQHCSKQRNGWWECVCVVSRILRFLWFRVRFRNTAPSNGTDGGGAYVWFSVYNNLH